MTQILGRKRSPSGLLPWLYERVHLPLAGALTAYLAFEAGGFFPGTVGVAGTVLVLALVARATLPANPLSGLTGPAAATAGAGALLASWTLLSASWSDAPVRAIVEFDRVLLYVLAFAFYATFPRRPGSLSLLLRWVVLAMVAAAVAGLATRLYPDVFERLPGRAIARLAYPLTYWNAMAVFCALGAVLGLHVACDDESPAWVRVAGTGALPVLAVAGYFPFSRGGIVVAALGVIAYAVLAHPRRLPFALAAAGPAVAVALAVAYGQDTLATERYYQGDGPAEGHHVAAVLLACCAGAVLVRLALLVLERRVVALAPVPARSRRLAFAAVAAIALCVAIALDAPARAEDQYHAFVEGSVLRETTDLRQRLGKSGNNGRLDFWRIDVDVWERDRLRGNGAGTYRLEWERRREDYLQAVDGHSLYLESLAELGIVGALLVVALLVGVLAAAARNLGAPDRLSNAALLAGGGSLLVHAGIDWDWEMPALMLWLFAAGGLAAARAEPRPGPGPPRLARVIAGLLCLLLAITPALVASSASALDRGWAAFDRGDCGDAVDGALDSLDALAVAPDPYEILAYCDLRGGQPQLAVRAMEAARRRDPRNWRFAYGLGIAKAFAGEDPRPLIDQARALNPLEPIVRDLAAGLRRADRPAAWRRAAARAQIPRH